MQNFLHACKRQLRLWRITRDIDRIHRQALRKARTHYDAIPLRDPQSYRRLVEAGRERENLCRAAFERECGGEGHS